MKPNLFFKLLIIIAVAISLSHSLDAQNIFPSSGSAGIGTTKPPASAALDIKSVTQGFLPPRMSLTQRNAISSPIAGLLIYQTTDAPGFYYYDGSSWQAITSNANAWLLTGNGGTSSTNFIGTTDAHDLYFRVNNNKAGLIDFTTSANTAFGYLSLSLNTSGGANTAIGYNALYSNTTGGRNTAVGYNALTSNTTGFSNTAIGEYALAATTTATSATATGHFALALNTTGSYITADGGYALASNTTGSGNTATGYSALIANTTGNANTADGDSALFSNTTGVYNTANGHGALLGNNTGYANTATGNFSMLANTTGTYNTADGVSALHDNIIGSKITAVGTSANVNAGNYTNSAAFGYDALITASNQVRIGDNNVTSIGGYANWTNISDERIKKNIKKNVPGLSFINKLNAVTYTLDLNAANAITKKPVLNDDDISSSNSLQDDLNAGRQKEQIIYTGFLAQDVEKAAKSIGYNFSGVDAAKNDKDLYGLRYAEFVVPLVKAVQELDAKNQELEDKVNQLTALVQSLVQNKLYNSKNSYLSQNIPNPGKESTLIPFQIAKGNTSATIEIVQTGSGKVLKIIPVDINATQITVNTSEFASGSYMYVLLVNGNMADSKQMIIKR